jgi:cytochrome c2
MVSPMPSSLHFVLGLLGAGTVLAAVAGTTAHKEENRVSRIKAEQLSGGDMMAGKAALKHYGCGGCHDIPGLAEAGGSVGPSLAGVAVRAQLAGHLQNNPDNMIRWLRDPQGVAPGNGMPNLGVSERDAKDMAAYLYTLKPTLPPS